MKLVVRCSECQAQYKVEEAQAHRAVKCPKCGGALAVMPATPDANPPAREDSGRAPAAPAPSPVRPAAASPAAASPAAAFPRPAAPVAPKFSSVPPPTPEPPSFAAESTEDSLNFLSQSGPMRSSFKPVERKPTEKKGSNATLWIIGGVCAALLLICGIVGFVVLGSSSTVVQAPPVEKKPPPQAKFVIDIPPVDRKDTTLLLDGSRTELPSDGVVSFTLKPGKHSVSLRRMGFAFADKTVSMKAGDEEHFSPKWESLAPIGGGDKDANPAGTTVAATPAKSSGSPTFSDWMQDVDAAVQKAATESKDVLVAFVNSADSESIALEYDVLLKNDFRKHMESKFEFVYIDLAQRSKVKVEDRERNVRTFRRFGLNEVQLPVVVLLDAEGQPFGHIPYTPGGLDRFLFLLPNLVDARDDRDKLFKAIDDAQGEEKLLAAKKALDWLHKYKLEGDYRDRLQQWKIIADEQDPKNEQGVQEVFFSDLLLSKLRGVFYVRDKKEAQKRLNELVDELKEWKGQMEFKDQDIAVRVHLALGMTLSQFDLSDIADTMANDALAYQPKDERLKQALKQIERASPGIAGSGSGFVVADGGYIMTNHHVIHGAKIIQVRLPGVKDAVDAKLIADESKAERDMALLKVDVPPAVKLKPLHVAVEVMGRGTSVGAFGYPLGDSIGKGLKFTNGVVSGLPDKTNEDMYLLDCRVNPGNSGGALCDSRGFVVGMVTAKIAGGFTEDSYGMAIPGATLREFLSKNIPKFEPGDKAAEKVKSMTWDKVDAAVSSSVLMILNKRK